MSYILDALKKVEREKVRKTMTGGMTSITGDLFQEQAKRPSRSGNWKIVAVTLFVALLTCAATWFMLKGEEKKSPPTAAQLPKTNVITTPPPSPLPVSAPQPLPAAPALPTAISVLPPPQPVDTENEGETAIEKRKSTAPPKKQKIIVQTIPAPADVKVSGIAWQEERSARRAVVNGFLLKEGASVSGAKIVDISQDRVRFSSPSGVFDVRMDAATMPTAPR